MNQGWSYREQISSKEVGHTLLSYYAHRYRHSSPADWRIRIESGQIRVDGQRANADLLLQPGQTLTYRRPPWEEPDVPLHFERLYQDRDLMAIAKPSGLPVMPGGGFLENTLLWQLQRQFSRISPSQVSPSQQPSTSSGSAAALAVPVPIHRLGRGTSGLVLLGRSPLAKSELTRQMRDRKVTKVYRALVNGADLPDTFTLETPIGKVPHPTLGHIFAADPQGKFAHSQGKVLRRNLHENTAIVEVDIFTGRPHQIRIHMATLGYPLVGDPLYQVGGLPCLEPDAQGRLPMPGDCGYWLHAARLGFEHPRSGQPMQLDCPPPDCLKTDLTTD